MTKRRPISSFVLAVFTTVSLLSTCFLLSQKNTIENEFGVELNQIDLDRDVLLDIGIIDVVIDKVKEQATRRVKRP